MNFSKYIDIPHLYKGSDFSGADCYGLIKLIIKEEKTITLPDFWYTEMWYKENKNHIINNMSKVKIIKVSPPYQAFDGLLFYDQRRKLVNHIGLLIEENKFIHTYRKNSSKIDRLEGYWKSRLYQGVRYLYG
ncbi:unnamed protein product [marine sediment metagenome]|uniref:NlpC/P60 domain-containing protein n=1 Tax=marine sediment metagenome TaxID=412755 RepID=X0VI31_9ZZZZ